MNQQKHGENGREPVNGGTCQAYRSIVHVKSRCLLNFAFGGCQLSRRDELWLASHDFAWRLCRIPIPTIVEVYGDC